jgi:HSP20 family protein
MRSIVTFSPFQELHRFADMMDRMWDTDLSPGISAPTTTVPMDVWEQDNKIFIKAAVPGVDPSKIDVSVDNAVLTISGEFSDEHETSNENKKFYHREFRYGKFTRSLSLPDDAEADKIDAEYKNGFITVQIPRKTMQALPQPKKVLVRNAEGLRGSTQSDTKSIENKSGENR